MIPRPATARDTTTEILARAVLYRAAAARIRGVLVRKDDPTGDRRRRAWRDLDLQTAWLAAHGHGALLAALTAERRAALRGLGDHRTASAFLHGARHLRHDPEAAAVRAALRPLTPAPTPVGDPT